MANVHPGNVPAYLPQGSPAENMVIRETWQKVMKEWPKDANVNKALVKWFLSLLPQEHLKLYQTSLIWQPYGRFENTYTRVYREYGICNKVELKKSREIMKAQWNPAEEFKILPKRFDEAIIFVAFAKNNISAGDTLTLLFDVILKTSVFQTNYKEWNNLTDNKRTLVNTLGWWGKKCRIKKNSQK